MSFFKTTKSGKCDVNIKIFAEIYELLAKYSRETKKQRQLL